MIVEHDFLMWIKNKQNVDRFLIFARSLMIIGNKCILFLQDKINTGFICLKINPFL